MPTFTFLLAFGLLPFSLATDGQIEDEAPYVIASPDSILGTQVPAERVRCDGVEANPPGWGSMIICVRVPKVPAAMVTAARAFPPFVWSCLRLVRNTG